MEMRREEKGAAILLAAERIGNFLLSAHIAGEVTARNRSPV